ncbi:MAG: STAS domain-containing protein, partial [Solirubrobacteraceae bacterium]
RRLSARASAEHHPEDDGGPGAAATFELRRERDVPVARLVGEVDLEGIAALGGTLADAVTDRDRGLVIDLDGVEYLDSAGLHLLHDTARALAARGQSLRVVVSADAGVARLLELVNLVRILPVDATVDAAVDALEHRPPP